MDGGTLHGLVDVAEPYLRHYGYAAIFGCICLENFGLPLPGQALLIAASLLASRGQFHIALVAITAWVAAIAGSSMGFAIGRYGGRRVLDRYGTYVGLPPKRLAWIDAFFARYGGWVLVIGRFLEGLRQINSILAGAGKMTWARFALFNALGATLWVGVWATLVYSLGRRSRHIIAYFRENEPLVIAAFVVCVIAAGIYLYRHRPPTIGFRTPNGPNGGASISEPSQPVSSD